MSLVFDYVICKNTGEQIGNVLNSLERKLTKQRNAVHTATIKLKLNDPLAAYLDPTLGTKLKVYRRATPAEILLNPSAAKQILVFFGSLPPTAVLQDGAEGTVAATFQDPRWIWQRRYLQTAVQSVTTGYAGTVRAVYNTMMDATGAVAGARLLSGDGAERISRNYDVGKSLWEVFNEMASLNDALEFLAFPVDGWTTFQGTTSQNDMIWVQYITPPVTTILSVANGPAVFTYGNAAVDGYVGGLPVNCLNMQRAWSDVINFALTSSTDASGNALYGSYGPIASNIGRVEAFESYSDAVDQATLTARAASLVTQNASPKMILTIQPAQNAPNPYADYDVGGLIVANCRVETTMVFTNQTCRVEGWSINISQNGEITDTGLVVTPQ